MLKISLIQPRIVRGDIESNGMKIQDLINKADGDLLILPEYGLTGSLVLDKNANVRQWVEESRKITDSLKIPESKHLLWNSLVIRNEQVYNCCQLIPTNMCQFKLFPDGPEASAGIMPGNQWVTFEIKGIKFGVIICTDLLHMDQIETDKLDFLVFVFHFTLNNFKQAFQDVKNMSLERQLPVFVSSLVSDQNIGHSCFINGEQIISLQDEEGILEWDFDIKGITS